MPINQIPRRSDVNKLTPRLWDSQRKAWVSRWRCRGMSMTRYAGDVVVASAWWNGVEDPEVRMQVMGEWGAHGPINRGTTLFAKICLSRGMQINGGFFDDKSNEITRIESLGTSIPHMTRGRGVYPATVDHMICAMIWCDTILEHIYKFIPSK